MSSSWFELTSFFRNTMCLAITLNNYWLKYVFFLILNDFDIVTHKNEVRLNMLSANKPHKSLFPSSSRYILFTSIFPDQIYLKNKVVMSSPISCITFFNDNSSTKA